MDKKIFISAFFIVCLSLVRAQTTIKIDNSVRYQTIDGWEATSNRLEATSIRDKLMPHLQQLIDKAVNDVGITRLRFGLNSGVEDSVDYFQQLIDGITTYDDYKLTRYSKINDNDDPNVSNPSGFQLSILDFNIQNLIIPFKNAVQKNGDRFYLNMCFVDFANQSVFHHSSDPEEYAELMSYAWTYMDSLYGFVPHGLEIILEPDNADVWNEKIIPSMIEAVGNRMKLLDYNPQIIAPSTLSLSNVPKYIDQIAANPVALDYLDVISYHRYSGNTNYTAQQEMVDLAQTYGKKLAMLEYDKNGDVNELHYDLKYNFNVAWTKYALSYPTNERWAYVYVDESDPGNPKYEICTQTKYLRQYFKFIRPGAVRIEALGGDNDIDPVAFSNANGKQVVVIKASVAGDISITGLQKGTYGIKYTIGNYDWATVEPKQYDIDLPEQTITSGNSLSFNMPDKGVVTIYDVLYNEKTEVPDTIAPVFISEHPNDTVGADENCFAALKDYTQFVKANDEKGQAVSITQEPQAGEQISGNENIVHLIISDIAGNTSKKTFHVSVTDTIAPIIISEMKDKLLEADNNCQAILADYTTEISGIDNCAGNIKITQSPAPGTLLEGGDNTIQILLTDASGNSKQLTLNVNITDNSKPEIHCIENQMREIAHNQTYYEVQGNEFGPIQTRDNCKDVSVINDFNNLSTLDGAQLPIGKTSITWSVSDTKMNAAQCLFDVTINKTVGIKANNKNIQEIQTLQVQNELHLQFKNNLTHTIALTDFSGKTLYKQNISGGNGVIDLSFLNSGIYLIKIISQKDIITLKMLKQ